MTRFSFYSHKARLEFVDQIGFELAKACLDAHRSMDKTIKVDAQDFVNYALERFDGTLLTNPDWITGKQIRDLTEQVKESAKRKITLYNMR